MSDIDDVFNSLTPQAIQKELAIFDRNGKDIYIKDASAKLKTQTGQGTSESSSYFIFANDCYYPMKAIARMARLKNGKAKSNYNSITFVPAMERLEFNIHHNPSLKLSKKANASAKSARDKVYYWTISRPEQAKFRKDIFKAYGAKCLFTGCDLTDALEAAHLVPFATGGRDVVENGIPLRSDVHKLFDYHLIAIDPETMKVQFSSLIVDSYCEHIVREIDLSDLGLDPNMLTDRWKEYNKK